MEASEQPGAGQGRPAVLVASVPCVAAKQEQPGNPQRPGLGPRQGSSLIRDPGRTLRQGPAADAPDAATRQSRRKSSCPTVGDAPQQCAAGHAAGPGQDLGPSEGPQSNTGDLSRFNAPQETGPSGELEAPKAVQPLSLAQLWSIPFPNSSVLGMSPRRYVPGGTADSSHSDGSAANFAVWESPPWSPRRVPPAFAWGEGPPRMPGYRSGGAKLPSPEGRQVSAAHLVEAAQELDAVMHVRAAYGMGPLVREGPFFPLPPPNANSPAGAPGAAGAGVSPVAAAAAQPRQPPALGTLGGPTISGQDSKRTRSPPEAGHARPVTRPQKDAGAGANLRPFDPLLDMLEAPADDGDEVSSPLKVRNPVQAADAAAMRIATPEDVAGAPVLLQPARAGRQLRTRSLIRPGAAQVSQGGGAGPAADNNQAGGTNSSTSSGRRRTKRRLF